MVVLFHIYEPLVWRAAIWPFVVGGSSGKASLNRKITVPFGELSPNKRAKSPFGAPV